MKDGRERQIHKDAMFDEAMASNIPLEDVPLFAWHTMARWFKKQALQK